MRDWQATNSACRASRSPCRTTARTTARCAPIRTIGASLGDGVKKVYDSELGPMKKLRRVSGVVAEAEIAAAAGEPVAV